MHPKREAVRELLDYDKFLAWLLAKKDDDLVGTPTFKDSCPIATYLKENGQEVWVDTDHVIEHDRGGVVICALPCWSKQFVRYVDSVRETSAMRAEDARTALEGVVDFMEEEDRDPTGEYEPDWYDEY